MTEADPTILHQSHLRGATFTSTFAEEAALMQLALEWATTNHPECTLTICTDSQSLLKAIERRSPVTHHLRSLLNARPGPTSLLWIPGHKGIPGSELADTAAKAAALATSDPPRPISYASARSLIRRKLKDPPPTNSRIAEVYGGFSWSKDCMATSNRVVATACTVAMDVDAAEELSITKANAEAKVSKRTPKKKRKEAKMKPQKTSETIGQSLSESMHTEHTRTSP